MIANGKLEFQNLYICNSISLKYIIWIINKLCMPTLGVKLLKYISLNVSINVI